MVNKEHYSLLKEGHLAWHKWRKHERLTVPNLRGADLRNASLTNYDMTGCDFRSAQLSGACLSGSSLSGCNFRDARLVGTIFKGADLREVNFVRSDFSQANLQGCRLHRSVFRDVRCAGSEWDGAKLYETVFAKCDLSLCKGLESVAHLGPSILDARTLLMSSNLPRAFLRGCGLPDRLIDYIPSLRAARKSFHSCFISYSSADQTFVDRLYAELQNNGVRCWFAPHDMEIGAPILDSIDRAIQLQDKLLLILSENAIASGWVEDEVMKAFAEERRRGQVVLLPVRIDDAVMRTDEPWAVKLRDQRNIGDFSDWEHLASYQRAFYRVLRGLRSAAAP